MTDKGTELSEWCSHEIEDALKDGRTLCSDCLSDVMVELFG